MHQQQILAHEQGVLVRNASHTIRSTLTIWCTAPTPQTHLQKVLVHDQGRAEADLTHGLEADRHHLGPRSARGEAEA